MAETPTLKLSKPQASASSSLEAESAPRAICTVAMLSHLGRVRHANQDACAALPEVGVFVVCDGMGGAAAGEVASQLAVDAFLHALEQPRRRRTRRATPNLEPNGNPNGGLLAVEDMPANYPESHPFSRLREAVCAANHEVFRHARKSVGRRGMGTTLVGALYEYSDATLWLGHVGDSRCYLMRAGTLQQLTEDHSLVEEQVRAGTLSRIDAAISPIRNIITRAVGSEPVVEPEIAAHSTRPGDVYLLATDGLTRELDDARIAGILSKFFPRMNTPAPQDKPQKTVLEAACQALVDAANVQGGHDNITVLLIGCP